MNLPEGMLAESLDEIITRSKLRLEQERVHVSELQRGSTQRLNAKANFDKGSAALRQLTAYRARLDS